MPPNGCGKSPVRPSRFGRGSPTMRLSAGLRLFKLSFSRELTLPQPLWALLLANKNRRYFLYETRLAMRLWPHIEV
jgi:hypothetical protein